MKIVGIVILLAALLGGCTTTGDRHQAANMAVIAKYLGGHFQVIGPVEESDIASADFGSPDRAQAIQARHEGAEVYFVFEPDYDTNVTDETGHTALYFPRTSLMLVLRDGEVATSYYWRPKGNRAPPRTPVSVTSAAAPAAGAASQ